MLVLLSFALVLVATVLLVLGLLSDDGLLLIYLSIGSSVVAAAVLLVALRVNRPRQEAGRAAPAPLPEPESEPAAEPALVGASPAPVAAPTVGQPATDPTASGEWLAGDQDAWAADEAADGDWDGEVDFPIADYDTLTTGQILPLLPQLYADEIAVVEERERATKGRAEILAKLDQLRASSSADPLASYTESTAGDGAADEWFPIEDYESLSAAQVRPLLRELDRDELAMVRDRELALGRRQTLLDEIDLLLGAGASPALDAATTQSTVGTPAAGSEVAEGPSASPSEASPASTGQAAEEAPAAKAPARSAAKKATTAKRATTKAAAKKAAPAKGAATKKAAATKATPAKKASATKATPAKKAATKKAAPAKKASAAKKAGTTKAAPAKKAATKTAAPAKKASAAKKAATKKAAPAKRAAKRTGR